MDKISIQHIKQQKISFQTLKVEISSYEDIKRPELKKMAVFISFTHQNSSNSDRETILF